MKTVSPTIRFWRFIDFAPTGCWLWTGARNHRGGYGLFAALNSRLVQAHRFAFEFLVGPIPAGFQIDHLCRIPRCVNPAHLEPVSARENTLRGFGVTAANAQKTHCLRGHPLTPDNLVQKVALLAKGWRQCRACNREDARRRRERA